MSVLLPAGANFFSSSTSYRYRPTRSSEEVSSYHITSPRSFPRSCCHIQWKIFRRLNDGSLFRSLIKNRSRAISGHLGSAYGPVKNNGPNSSEEIAESASRGGEDARLTAAEATRTIVEVNCKASFILNRISDAGFTPKLVWGDFSYVTDEHGNIYFQLENDEIILQNFTSERSSLQVIIGFDDSMKLIKEADLSGSSEIDFGIGNVEDDDVDEEDEDGKEEDDDDELFSALRCLSSPYKVPVLEDENNHDDEDNFGLGDWAKLETMRTSYPTYFARKIAEVALDDPVDWMEQPPAGLAIQGLLRPALAEEQSNIRKLISTNRSKIADSDINGKNVEGMNIIKGQRQEEVRSSEYTSTESENDEIPTLLYKLKISKIQLITADRRQRLVDLEDYQRACPDVIAHAAFNIVSRFKAGGEKTVEALKSLCWRCKDIQVEEATLVSVDSLGFDVRVCSRTQLQTLRFVFKTRATSEDSAERQLNDLLFPR